MLIAVPSGILEIGVMLPGLRAALSPIAILEPIAIPSVATTRLVYPSGSFRRARGAVWTGLWISSVTSPTTSSTRGIVFVPGNL